jgi:predicted GIY-YIG superfamily endonuclease
MLDLPHPPKLEHQIGRSGYTETVPDRATALKRELEIKKKKSRNYI